MKMVKKILLGLTAAAAVISFVSCSGIANDNAEKEGDKKELTIKVNNDQATGYKRAFEQLGKLEQLQAVTVTLSCKKDDVSNNSVIGFAFDLNYEKDENEKDIKDSYNFYLVGFQPSTGKYYVERYKEVSMKDNNGNVTSDAMGKYISYVNSKWETEYKAYDDWIQGAKDKEYAVDTDGNLTLKIAVTQATDGVYSIKLGNGAVIKCPVDTRTVNKKDTKLQGGIAVYANAKPGANFSVTCKVDEDSVVGKWEAEEIDE